MKGFLTFPTTALVILWILHPVCGATLDLATVCPQMLRDRPREIVDGQRLLELPNGARATTVVFRQTRWELKNVPQSALTSASMEDQAMTLSEAERLKVMNRIDDHTQVWVVALDQFPQAGPALKPLLKPTDLPHESYRELAYLGRGNGMAWYAFMPIYEWVNAQKKLGLKEGEDPLAAAARGLSVADRGNMTANSVPFIFVDAGIRSLDYLKPVVEGTNYWRALRAVDGIKDPAADENLMELAETGRAEVAQAARRCLEYNYRKAALPLYLKWLEQDAGRGDVYRILLQLGEKAPEKLTPYLPRVLAAPATYREYRLALELSRKVEGKDLPERLLKIEEDIRMFGNRSSEHYDQQKVDALARELARAQDVEAAAVIATDLAIAITKGDWTPANKAGLAVLDGLPDGRGRQFLVQLSDTCRDPDFKERINNVRR